MKVTLNWLREFVRIEMETTALCERLTLGGLEVESVEEVGAAIRDVVVGEIVSTAAHPSAERLTVCQVRRGPDAPVPVVCGATNMKAGDRVAFAPPGATLPGGRRITSAEIRGVFSAGMLCSEAELGLSEDASGILLFPPDARLGERVGACLKVEDTVLDIAVTPNRGDCLSILGIAREIAALCGGRLLRHRRIFRERGAPAAERFKVRIEDPVGCARYAARLFTGLRVRPSPRWFQQRLQAVGLRPINNLVDVTNYVMIERGQPLHAFDFDRLPRPEIVVRRAGASRTIRTLDGAVRDLVPEDLLITTGDDPIAIAGVMGGADSEVRDDTTSVLLESAWFDPGSVRRTAQRLDLGSEAAFRFERGVDIGGVVAALDRAAELLQKLGGGDVAPGVVDAYPGLRPVAPIHVRLKRTQNILGLAVSRSEASTVLRALGADVAAGPRGSLAVTPPTYRSDLAREIDVIEELARVIGYDRIPATLPTVTAEAGRLPEWMRWAHEIRRLLCAHGMHEAVSFSFASARSNQLFRGVCLKGDPAVVLNPLSQDDAELRLSLMPGLVRMWQLNRSQGAKSVAGFEIGKVFWRAQKIHEAWRLGGVLAGAVPWRGLGSARDVEFADAKGVVEAVLECLGVGEVRWQPPREGTTFHPGKSAVISVREETAGFLGALHPEAETELGMEGAHWLFELDLERLLTYVPDRRFFQPLPRFPAIARDLAVVADEEFASDQVIRFVGQGRHPLVEEIVLFDEYSGAPIPDGKKSLAYSISYRAPDRTLTDEEVNRVHENLVDALSRELPVEPRR